MYRKRKEKEKKEKSKEKGKICLISVLQSKTFCFCEMVAPRCEIIKVQIKASKNVHHFSKKKLKRDGKQTKSKCLHI